MGVVAPSSGKLKPLRFVDTLVLSACDDADASCLFVQVSVMCVDPGFGRIHLSLSTVSGRMARCGLGMARTGRVAFRGELGLLGTGRVLARGELGLARTGRSGLGRELDLIGIDGLGEG